MITAISPIDGRYASKVAELEECFSEYAPVEKPRQSRSHVVNHPLR